MHCRNWGLALPKIVQTNTARHTQKQKKDSNEQLIFAAFLHFLPNTITKSWKPKFSNFNCSAAKIITFWLQHRSTKIKPKQNKQKPSKLILKRNGFGQIGWELLSDSWPEASYPWVMRFSKFWLAGKPNLHNNKYKKWLLFSVLDVHTPPLQQCSASLLKGLA